ncbi:MAG: PEP-CTERM sorting domain-containing protein [Phycisphaeraceae bacterium]|nr:PEP-CTERM sorting domain-containing protein [Phycisphaeraceae bacterium]
MMKSMIAAVVGVAGIAAGANAAWGLKFEVWDGGAWVSSVSAAAGDVVKFRFGAYFDPNSAPVITTADGTGTAQAMTRFTGSNQATGFAAGDVFQNVVKTISSGNAALTQVAGATIGTTAVTSFGSQLFLADVPFEPYKEIYVGEVKIGADNSVRSIEIKNKTFGSGNTAGLTFYNSASPVNKQSGAPQSGGPGREDMIATIRVVPAPGSLALLGLGGLVAARRRRA